MEDVIGTIAATLTTIAFLPQVVKVLRTKETHAISLSMYVIFTTGVCFWLGYGILLGRVPIIVANIITLILSIMIIIAKWRYGRNDDMG